MARTLQNFWERYTAWWEKQSNLEQWAFVSLCVSFCIGAAFRFTNLAASLQFQADQGRDAIVAYNILHGDIALLGPSTSVGSMYLGPLYYYFMAPFISLFGMSPIGPAIAVATLSLLTLPILFLIVRRWLGVTVATFSVLAYATAPWVVEYSRFSWNPNPAPIVSLLLWWSAWKALQGKYRWWMAVGLWAAVLMQLHYVALLAIAPVGVWWLWNGGELLWKRSWHQLRSFLLWSFGAGLVVLASFTPLVAFDIRFDGLIRSGFEEFLSGSQSGEASSIGSLQRVWREQEGRTLYSFGEFWGGKDSIPAYRTVLKSVLLGVGVVWLFFAWRLRSLGKLKIWMYLTSIIVTSIVGLAWYRGVLHAHYITYLYPIVGIVLGSGVTELACRGRLGRVFAGILLSLAIGASLIPGTYYFLDSAGWQYKDMRFISQRVLAEVPKDATYSLTLLSEIRDYRGMNYRYFLITSDHPPIDLAVSHEADYLVIIAESPDEAADVLGSPVYEIVTFPKGQYRVVQEDRGPKIYIIENRDKTLGIPENDTP